jgi:hypothetical protein
MSVVFCVCALLQKELICRVFSDNLNKRFLFKILETIRYIKRIQKFAQNEKNLLKSHSFKCAIYVHYKKFLSVNNYAISANGDFCMS